MTNDERNDLVELLRKAQIDLTGLAGTVKPFAFELIGQAIAELQREPARQQPTLHCGECGSLVGWVSDDTDVYRFHHRCQDQAPQPPVCEMCAAAGRVYCPPEHRAPADPGTWSEAGSAVSTLPAGEHAGRRATPSTDGEEADASVTPAAPGALHGPGSCPHRELLREVRLGQVIFEPGFRDRLEATLAAQCAGPVEELISEHAITWVLGEGFLAGEARATVLPAPLLRKGDTLRVYRKRGGG